MNDCIKILFIGDIVGRPGRRIVEDYLSEKGSVDSYDFVIANVENASHGFGLTKRNHDQLSECGIDAFTSGNHIWDRKEIFDYIDQSQKLVRPLNYTNEVPGVGSRIFESKDFSIGVISLLGQVFMNSITSPWQIIEAEIKKLKEKTSIIIIDFHAEATAEKVSFGYYADTLGVSAVLGTHTHVQTADEKVLTNGCAYITDAGFCGASEGVIGMDIKSSFKRLKTGLPERFDVAPMDKAELNGVKILLDRHSGKACCIERIKYYKDFSEDRE